MLAITYETAVVAKRAHLAEVVGNNALILHYQIPEYAVYRKDSGDPVEIAPDVADGIGNDF